MINLETVLKRLETENVFLTGGAGVGKTTLTNRVIRAYEAEGKQVAKLASTGMAATLLGGQTMHSFFEFGTSGSLEELERTNKLSISKKLKRLLGAIDLIVIDEISMVSARLLDMVRLRLLQAECKAKVLAVGDFLQLPPIGKDVRFAFESESWERFSFVTVMLDEVHRTDDTAFIHLLHKVRFGYVDADVRAALDCFVKPLPNDLRHYTFLFGTNNSAAWHNKTQLTFIEGETVVKNARVEYHDKNVSSKEVERFFEDARVEKELELKVGAPVLFTRNSWNYYNGERGEVVKIEEDCVYVKKSAGGVVKLEMQKQSKTKWVEKTKNGKQEVVEEALFSIYQYPIKLAFAITVHKSQGMSIEDLIIESNEIFAPSQFYVALSRANNPARLTITPPRRAWHSLIFVHRKAVDFYRRLPGRYPAEKKED